MTQTPIRINGVLDESALKLLSARPGPCITIQVPDFHPGARDGARRTLLRDLVNSARAQIGAAKVAGAAGLLDPLENIAHEEANEAGGPAFAIFRSPHFLARYAVPSGIAGQAAVASHFNVTPFLAAALAPQELFVLGLSRKRLRLFEYKHGECRELELPHGVPASLEDAGGFDQPDHDLENRSSAGTFTGVMGAVRFGTLSDREAAPEYFHHYVRLIDEGLKPTLGAKPVLLAGVREQTSAYRRFAQFSNFLDPEITGTVEFLTAAEIANQAATAAAAYHTRLGERVLAAYREMGDRRRTLGDVREVLRAAIQGRVHQLCVRAQTAFAGAMEPEVDSVHVAEEDLINAAAVETLKAGGEVFVLPQQAMPAAAPLVAILRH
jgi:hypothetical protein